MRVIYNGIDLCVIETHIFDTESVYDDSGMNYLYTRVVISVRAVVNGQVEQVNLTAPGPFISYKMQRSGSSVGLTTRSIPDYAKGSIGASDGMQEPIPTPTMAPVFVAVNSPVLTHQAIRHRLNTPRGKLWIFSGKGNEGSSTRQPFPTGSEAGANALKGVSQLTTADFSTPWGGAVNSPTADVNGDSEFETGVCLECPSKGCVVDCKNGPKPRVLSVVSALGDSNTFMVDWTCEAYINEGPSNNINPSGALLSNVFSQTHDVDEDGFLTMHTEGEAIYRTDEVWKLLRNPDLDRSVLIMPIPNGFVRSNINVTGLPDVTGVHYSYSDKQQKVNFPAGAIVKASHIDVLHHQEVYINADVLSTLASGIERFASYKAFTRKEPREDPGKKKSMLSGWKFASSPPTPKKP